MKKEKFSIKLVNMIILYIKKARAEQKKIEHVNCFLKKYYSIGKVWTRSHGLLNHTFIVCCGLYNIKKLIFGYYKPSNESLLF